MQRMKENFTNFPSVTSTSVKKGKIGRGRVKEEDGVGNCRGGYNGKDKKKEG